MSHSVDMDCPWCDAAVAPGTHLCPHCGRELSIIAGRYRIESQRGRSDRGAVYSALHLESQTRVAAKFVALANSDWRSAEQFERGARALQGLRHPAVPEVYDFACDEQFGKLIVVREYLDDETLQERVEGGWHVDAAGFATLFDDLLELAAHLHGLVPTLVHRDIQPSNIMFRSRSSWNPVLVDFDAMSGPERGDDTLHIAGTSAWAAPEQLAGAAGPVSDLYSIGLTMVYVATHLAPDQLPTDVDGNFLVDALLGGLEPRQRQLVERLIARNPAMRPQSAAVALAELHGRTVVAPGTVPDYVAPDAMTSREIEARIDGWLALGDQGSRDARLLIPYLARLDAIGYARYRGPIARRGGIDGGTLDRAVDEARRQIAPRKGQRRRPPPQLPRHLTRHRPPGSTGAAGIIFVPIFVALIGMVVAFQAHRLANEHMPSNDDPRALTVTDDGTPCGLSWLDVVDEPPRQCLYWLPAGTMTRGDAGRIKLGCHEDPEVVVAACNRLRQTPGAAPGEIGDSGGLPVLEAAAEAGLVDGVVPAAGARMLFGNDGAVDDPATATDTADQAQDPAPDGEPRFVELELVSAPPGARVEVDGQPLCETPCVATIPYGGRPTFVVTLDGREQKRRVYALSNKRVEFDLSPR